MARKRKANRKEKSDTYDIDVSKRLTVLERERKTLGQELMIVKKKMVKEKRENEWQALEVKMMRLAQQLGEVDGRISFLSAQARILECDDKPVDVHLQEKRELEDELQHSYCAKCASPDMKITKIYKIECRKCGRKRLITVRLDESKK